MNYKTMRKTGTAFAASIIAPGLIIAAPAAAQPAPPQENCNALYGFAYASYSPLIPGFNDINATYWAVTYRPQDGVALQIDGEFPFARYASWTTYNLTGDATAQIVDADIEPAAGSQNPYRPFVKRDIAERSYSLRVAQRKDAGAPVASSGTARVQTLAYPDFDPSLPGVYLLYRVYYADTGKGREGGVPLPTITAVDARTGQPVACPERVPYGDVVEVSAFFNKAAPEAVPEIVSYRPRTDQGQANGDNPYLAARLSKELGDVAAISLRIPRATPTLAGGGFFDGTEEVRYTSVCLVGFKLTGAYDCPVDEGIPQDASGLATLFIGPEALRKNAPSNSTYLAWDRVVDPVIWVRQILARPGFIGRYEIVPEINAQDRLGIRRGDFIGKEADRFIGDYAVTGRYCDAAAFIAQNCAP